MITITATPMMAIRLGRLGENERLRVAFDVSALQAELPGASFTIINQGPGDATAYPCPGVTVEDGTLYWPITSAELQQTGRGRCELIVTVGDVVAKSVIYGTEILEALDGSGEAPEPWDSWQTEFAGMVADAQAAAADAAESVEHYPRIENGVWMVWDAQSGAFVSTGVQAQGPQGERGETGETGPQGEPGQPGTPGQDGVSPTVTVTQTATGATLTVTDAEGTTTAEISNGQDGAPGAPGNPGTPGISPTVTVTDITGGHRITITDADGAHSFDVMDGDVADAPVQSVNGQTGAVVLDAADVGAGTYSKPSGGIPASDLAAGVIPTVPVQDVQVNGVSVLNDGVANVPIGNTTRYGVVKLQAYGGLQLGSTNLLKTDPASESIIKSGSDVARPIVPGRQNASTFYGLAKAAGDTTQSSSSNAVGNYTDDARIAIQKMLGIYEAPWELIREDTVTNATEADIEITADGNGQAFELTDVRISVESPKQDTQFNFGTYGQIQVKYDASGNFIGLYAGAYTQAAGANARFSFGTIEQQNGMLVKMNTTNTSSGGTPELKVVAQNGGFFQEAGKIFNTIVIKSITGKLHYKIYGRRKWN